MRKLLIPTILCLALVAIPAPTQQAKASGAANKKAMAGCEVEQIISITAQVAAEAACSTGTQQECIDARSAALRASIRFLACMSRPNPGN
ncbi:MAG: hypothetical protein QOF02_419 [Blastocatellia bacterium]|jgi:hypothetical protein|nr:hypothetical protein [Blastocatellia bacterium]